MAEGAPQVILDTTIGSITVELYYKQAPKACRNFIELARKGYYNNVVVRALGLRTVSAARQWFAFTIFAACQWSVLRFHRRGGMSRL